MNLLSLNFAMKELDGRVYKSLVHGGIHFMDVFLMCLLCLTRTYCLYIESNNKITKH